jgi:DNA-binding NtrC family response regulator
MATIDTADTATFVTTGRRHSCPAAEHPYNLQRAIERFERDYLHNILVLAGWDKLRAAEMLGIHPRTLALKMKRYDLRSDFKTQNLW